MESPLSDDRRLDSTIERCDIEVDPDSRVDRNRLVLLIATGFLKGRNDENELFGNPGFDDVEGNDRW
jgi:hypothetical protein